MSEEPARDEALIYSFFLRGTRMGPGSEASTRQAFELLPKSECETHIVEFGCGAGATTLVLAQDPQVSVTAIDLYPPFIEALQQRAQTAGVQDRIAAIVGDMGSPPVQEQSCDLVWCEAAIYSVGFTAALNQWKMLLKPGGAVAISEAVWLTEARPAPAVEFWRQAYPAMTSIAENRQLMRQAGYESVADFVLPASDWHEYYEPLSNALPAFRKTHAG